MTVPDLIAGQEVTWMHVPRGGYGYPFPVDATVVQVYRSTVRIKVKLRDGTPVERRVSIATLRPRTEMRSRGDD